MYPEAGEEYWGHIWKLYTTAFNFTLKLKSPGRISKLAFESFGVQFGTII